MSICKPLLALVALWNGLEISLLPFFFVCVMMGKGLAVVKCCIS